MIRYAILFAIFATASGAETAEETTVEIRKTASQAAALCKSTERPNDFVAAISALDKAAARANAVAITEGVEGRTTGAQEYVKKAYRTCNAEMRAWLAKRQN